MKKLLLILFVIVLSGKLFAQGGGAPGRTRTQTQVLALPFREVSGVVKDTADNTIIGATITLTSKSDTLRASTNSDGIFVIKNVKQAVFVLNVKELGYLPITRKYLNNDAIKRVVLEPIIMHSASHMMNEVKINGVPSITYKPDTVEYRASDYKVHANATVDELLKKMEGMEVGSDGSLTHQGQQVTKAKLNGKTYASGDIATAIQNLPADIVEKIQIVDDYGDQAARTGLKDGDPQKVLNITTRADRSVGTTGRLILRGGNDDRYFGNLFVQRINANQQLGVIGNLSNTVNGVASTGLAGGATNGGGGGAGVGANARGSSSPGTTKSGGPNINYRDQWSKKVQVTFGYGYNFSDNNSINTSYGQNYSYRGSSNFQSQSTSQSNSTNHNFNAEMDYTIDSANYLQINPTFTYSGSNRTSNSYNNTIGYYDQVAGSNPPIYGDIEHPVTTGLSSNLNNVPNYGMTLLFSHNFKKPRRVFSMQLSGTRSNTQANGEKNQEYINYSDSTETLKTRDSLVHELTNRSNINTTLRGSITYSEPISSVMRFDINAQTRKSSYNASAITDSVLANGQVKELSYLSNIYNYSFTESRISLDYRYEGIKWTWQFGTTLVPSVLEGTKLNNGIGANVSSSRSDFRVIPVFRFAYQWSRTERITLTYSGQNAEPSFTEIQPFVDRTDPNNIIYGNPDLKPTFTNSINLQYNNYIANSKLNFSFGVNGTYVQDQISSNNISQQVLVTPAVAATPTTPAKSATYRTINNNYYVNLDDTHAIVGRYNIAKQLDDRKYNLSLNGNITYSYSVAQSGNMNYFTGAVTDVVYHNTNWRFDERFGPRIDPTENIEINPYIGYDISRSFTTLAGANPTSLQTKSLAVDGYVYFHKTSKLTYSAAKSYVTGLQSLNTNPLVINAGFEQEFLAKKNLVFTFNIFDLLHQNNFIQQTLTAQGVTNTLSNSLSRYFLIGMRLNLQKWSGTPTRNGKQMMRRGDGSFIY